MRTAALIRWRGLGFEVQSELYVALDEAYISKDEFDDTYEQARRTRAAIRGFINYLEKSKYRKENPTTEP